MSNYNKVKTEGLEKFEKRWNYASFTWNGDNATGVKMAKQVRKNIKSFLSTFAENIKKAVEEDILEFVGEVEYDENAEEENSGAYEYHARNAERQRIRDYIKTLTK